MSRISILPAELDLNNCHLPLLRLPHPRTGIPSLFFPFTSSNHSSILLELQAVDPPNPRSWFVDHSAVSDGRLLMMTPIDPAFVLLPILHASLPMEGAVDPFRPAGDIFEDAMARLTQSSCSTADPNSKISAEDILSFVALDCAKQAMSRICEVKEISEELLVYRYSREKVIHLLQSKVDAAIHGKQFETNPTMIRGLAKNGLMDDGNEGLLKEGKIQAACDLIGHYVPPEMKAALLSCYDLSALEKHLRALQELTVSVPVVASKGAKGKDAAAKADKRKAKVSHGVEQLKKANTKGMAKISSFFAKT